MKAADTYTDPIKCRRRIKQSVGVKLRRYGLIIDIFSGRPWIVQSVGLELWRQDFIILLGWAHVAGRYKTSWPKEDFL